LADAPQWAYDNSAQSIKRQLADEFAITVRYGIDAPVLSSSDYDLVHICWWGEKGYQLLGFDGKSIIKEISSHRWEDNPEFGPCTPDEFARRYLSDCHTAICTSRRLTQIVEKVFPRTFHTPNGVDVTRFRPGKMISRQNLVFGWAGKPEDGKGFREIVQPACGDRFPLRAATGDLSHRQMEKFYRDVDVIVVASKHEGEPLTLIEAMASGCFAVCADVGIVPELIEHGRNGYIVPERSVEGFEEAFNWCERHREAVRVAGFANAELIARDRSWAVCAQSFARVYRNTLARR
jgi:glycosyltransferase involved in cell wall biosynthesis